MSKTKKDRSEHFLELLIAQVAVAILVQQAEALLQVGARGARHRLAGPHVVQPREPVLVAAERAHKLLGRVEPAEVQALEQLPPVNQALPE